MSAVKQSGKQIWVIGLGLGGKRLVTRQESAALKLAQLYIGSGAALDYAREYAAANGGRLYQALRGEEMRREILEAREERIAVLTQGDPGSSGELDELWPSLRDLKPVIFPGISIASYVASRTGMSCAGAPLVDLRRGQANLAQICRLHEKVLVLTSSDIRPVMRGLTVAGLGKTVACVLEHPGEATEKMSTANIRELSEREILEHAVILLVRGSAAPHYSFGIREEEFRASSSALPSELRAVMLSKLGIREKEVVYVIGSACGDTVVEAACASVSGIVYAVEEDEAFMNKTLENCRRFGTRNVRVIKGTAPAALSHVEPADVLILRGAKENTKDLIQIGISRNPGVRIAVITRTLETAAEAMHQMEERGQTAELLTLSGSRCQKEGERHALSETWTYFLVTSLRT